MMGNVRIRLLGVFAALGAGMMAFACGGGHPATSAVVPVAHDTIAQHADSIAELAAKAGELLGLSVATDALAAAYKPGRTFAQAFADFTPIHAEPENSLTQSLVASLGTCGPARNPPSRTRD